MLYGSSDRVRFGLIAEAVEGTFENSAPFPVALLDGLGPTYNSNTLTVQTITGAAQTIGARTNLRSFDASTPFTLRYSDGRTLIAPPMRDTFPAEVTIVGAADIDMLVAGTHQDGSTGPQIEGPLSTAIFDTFIGYKGATTNGAEFMMLKMSGWSAADNNLPRRIKAVWKDATNSYIDLYPGYVGGAAGAYGAPVTGAVGQSPTLKLGSGVRTGTTDSSYSFLWNYTDLAVAGWQNAFGMVANDLSMTGAGKEYVTMATTWQGYGSGEIVSADPSGQGFTTAALLYGPELVSIEDLTYWAVVTSTTPTVFSGFNITGWNWTLAGNNRPVEDVAGSSLRTGIVRGTMGLTASFDFRLASDARTLILSQLGSAASAEKAIVDMFFTDTAGNVIVVGLLENEFSSTGGTPGAMGSDVTINLTTVGSAITQSAGLLVWQEFSA